MDGKAIRKNVFLETSCALEMVLEFCFPPHLDSCNNSAITFHSASITSPFSSFPSPKNIIVSHVAELDSYVSGFSSNTHSSCLESVEHLNEYQMNRKGKGEIILLGPNVVVRK